MAELGSGRGTSPGIDVAAKTKRGRSTSARPARRGAPVVDRTLQAVLEELGRHGYAALRVEDVATRAGVNKTTVYRRWPTKEALVRAALASITERHGQASTPDTGSVREDLLVVARRVFAAMRSREGRTIMRMLAAEDPDPQVLRIARSIQQTREHIPRAVLERARARGEVRADVDAELVLDVVRGACEHALARSVKLDERFVTSVVDLVLAGALAPSAPSRRR